MNRKIDDVLQEIRNTPVSCEAVEQAASRVLSRLKEEHNKVVALPVNARIGSCEDFQSLIPAYLTSSLTSSRKLLFEDHIHECVTCRHALEVLRGSKAVAHSRRENRSYRRRPYSRSVFAYATAAALLLALAAIERESIRDFVFPIDVHAVAESVSGGLFRVSGQEIRSVGAGERIDRGDAIRTGNDSEAVLRLADGSRIEMNARSELSLDRSADGIRVKLVRGSAIVTATKQRNGHLYVATDDCIASVVGTVFSVSSAVRGSRVSVIDGEVQVRQSGLSTSLHRGQQMTTNGSMAATALSDELAWSHDRDLHLAILTELNTFTENLSRRIESQPMRHTSTLLGLVPAGAVVFLSLPNLAEAFAQSYTAMKERIAENPVLQAWWTEHENPGRGGVPIDEMITRVTRLGAYLGPEIIIAGKEFPVLLADVLHYSDLLAALQDDVDRTGAAIPKGPKIRIATNRPELASLGPATDTALVLYVDPKFLIAASKAQQIEAVLSGANHFTSTKLYQRVSQAYTNGVGWLAAADLEHLVDVTDRRRLPPGLDNVQQLLIEQKTGSDGPAYQAVLSFQQPRTGIAAWLAPPASIGATAFLSPNTYGAAAILTSDPELILDDILAILRDTPATLEIRQFEQEHHVDVRFDVASRLGNEFLVGIDGPLLPTPAWKAVIEVNDAARLQNTIQLAVNEINRSAAGRQSAPLSFSMEAAGGKTFYSIKARNAPTEVHYTFWAGYMIVAPNRSLLEEAIQYHDSGSSLARSESFRSQFPADGRDNASGFIYQNVGALTKALPMTGAKNLIGNAPPSLVCLYGEPDRIVLSSKGLLGHGVGNLAGLTGMIHAIGIQ